MGVYRHTGKRRPQKTGALINIASELPKAGKEARQILPSTFREHSLPTPYFRLQATRRVRE